MRLYPPSFLTFSWKVALACSWVVLSACFLPVDSRRRTAFFHLVLSFSRSWQCLWWYKILRNFVRLLCMSWGFTHKSHLFSGPLKPSQVLIPSFYPNKNRFSPGMGLKVPSGISTIVEIFCFPLGYVLWQGRKTIFIPTFVHNLLLSMV